MVKSDFDALHRRLAATRDRQAEALAETERQLYTLEKLLEGANPSLPLNPKPPKGVVAT